MDKNPDEVAAMFDGVAKRYDLVNDLLSLGRTKAWRKATTKIIEPRPGMKILDLAAGTGSSSEPLAAAGAEVIPADFSEGMLAAGRKARPHLRFTKADALNLPFADGEFDLATISFGLRNTQKTDRALAQMLRVTKPGGYLVVTEFSSPTFAPFRAIYTNYLMKALPAVARKTSSNPDAYIYLAESIRAWPDQRALAAQIEAAGWVDVTWKNLTGGVVAVHKARMPYRFDCLGRTLRISLVSANPYIPILVIFAIGLGFAVFSVAIAAVTGPARYNRAKLEAYECGIEPSPQALEGGRFPVKYFLTAMLFIVFDIEIVFLYPWAVTFDQLGLFGLVEMAIFIGTVFVAFAYVWRRGGLDWD